MAALTFAYYQFACSPALRPFIFGYGLFRSEIPAEKPSPGSLTAASCRTELPADDPLVEQMVASGCAQMCFNLGDEFTLERESSQTQMRAPAYVGGAWTVPGRMRLGRRVEMLGVMFRPGRTGAFFGPPADELTDRFTPLDDLWGAGGRAIERELRELPTTTARIRRLDAELLGRLAASKAQDDRCARIAEFVRQQRGSITVAALCRASGLSRQHLAREFRARVGISPKRFARVARFEVLMDNVYSRPQHDWATAAADCGYYDQAHLIAEFKAFTGMTPVAFFRPPAAAGASRTLAAD
jgi:AraC-like DNA-binding protein